MNRIGFAFVAFLMILMFVLWRFGGGWNTEDSDNLSAAISAQVTLQTKLVPSSVSFTAIKSFQGGERKVSACVRVGSDFYEVQAALTRNWKNEINEPSVGPPRRVTFCFGFF